MPADRHTRQADRQACRGQSGRNITHGERLTRETRRGERNMVVLRLSIGDVANSSASVNARARLCLMY